MADSSLDKQKPVIAVDLDEVQTVQSAKSAAIPEPFTGVGLLCTKLGKMAQRSLFNNAH
jgi:hypothetical protein